MFKVIDNKKIEISEEEWRLYQDICKSYGNDESLFKNLVETDENGLITLLKPPSSGTTMEIVLFWQNLMIAQKMRVIQMQFDYYCKKIDDKLKKIEELLTVDIE